MKALLKVCMMFAVVAILCVALSSPSQAAPSSAVSIDALAYHGCHGGWGGGWGGGYYGACHGGGYYGGYYGGGCHGGGFYGGYGGHGCHW